MAKIVPTVGRIVWCFSRRWSGELPGIIVHALGNTPDALINVNVFDDGVTDREAGCFNMLGVRIYDPDEPRNADLDHCTWMPHQMGQATRTEQLQALTEQRILDIVREQISAAIILPGKLPNDKSPAAGAGSGV